MTPNRSNLPRKRRDVLTQYSFSMFFCYRQKILGEIRQYQSELGCNSELPSILTQVLQYRQSPLVPRLQLRASINTYSGTTVQAVPIGTRLQLRASVNTYSGTTVQAVPIGTRLQLRASVNTYSGTTEQAVPIGTRLQLRASINTYSDTTVHYRYIPIGFRLQLRASVNTYSGTVQKDYKYVIGCRWLHLTSFKKLFLNLIFTFSNIFTFLTWTTHGEYVPKTKKRQCFSR
jgi:hypothetical protein